MTTIDSVGAPSLSGASPAAADSPAAQKQMFLQLLVAEIKNQDPLNPADGTEFLAQLATFTQVEETLAMRAELESIHQILAAGAEASQAQVEKP